MKKSNEEWVLAIGSLMGSMDLKNAKEWKEKSRDWYNQHGSLKALREAGEKESRSTIEKKEPGWGKILRRMERALRKAQQWVQKEKKKSRLETEQEKEQQWKAIIEDCVEQVNAWSQGEFDSRGLLNEAAILATAKTPERFKIIMNHPILHLLTVGSAQAMKQQWAAHGMNHDEMEEWLARAYWVSVDSLSHLKVNMEQDGWLPWRFGLKKSPNVSDWRDYAKQWVSWNQECMRQKNKSKEFEQWEVDHRLEVELFWGFVEESRLKARGWGDEELKVIRQVYENLIQGLRREVHDSKKNFAQTLQMPEGLTVGRGSERRRSWKSLVILEKQRELESWFSLINGFNAETKDWWVLTGDEYEEVMKEASSHGSWDVLKRLMNIKDMSSFCHESEEKMESRVQRVMKEECSWYHRLYTSEEGKACTDLWEEQWCRWFKTPKEHEDWLVDMWGTLGQEAQAVCEKGLQYAYESNSQGRVQWWGMHKAYVEKNRLLEAIHPKETSLMMEKTKECLEGRVNAGKEKTKRL